MGTVKWTDGIRKAKESEIRRVEQFFKVQFPDDYREFVKNSRGGKPSPQEIKVKGRSSPFMVRTLLNFKPGDDYYLLENYDWIKDRLASGLVPIASDPGGNYLATGEPSIVYWDHESDQRKKKPFLHVASSFTEFVDNLRDYSDDE